MRFLAPYVTGIVAAAIIGMASIVAVQTYRLGKCQAKATQLITCQEVNELERNARDATNDDLADDISQP